MTHHERRTHSPPQSPKGITVPESLSPQPHVDEATASLATPPAGPPAGLAYAGTHMPIPAGGFAAAPVGQVGKIRGTGVCILLMFITFGVYSIVWYYQTHTEMKRHTGQGIGGGIALILALFVGFVMPYLTSSEVGDVYERAGQKKPVSGATGLWYFPGILILVGPLVWFIKTNGALNAYWRSVGTR
jgi:hypothetical protein